MLTSSDSPQAGLTIKVPVKVMAVVTDQLRQELASECQDNLRKLEYELEQLSVQLRRLKSERSYHETGEMSEAEHKLSQEKQARESQRVQWRERLKEIAQLQLGTLLLQGTAEGLVTVQVGMKWDELGTGRIIIKDGVVVGVAAKVAEEKMCNG